jgi:hypothetical protein
MAPCRSRLGDRWLCHDAAAPVETRPDLRKLIAARILLRAQRGERIGAGGAAGREPVGGRRQPHQQKSGRGQHARVVGGNSEQQPFEHAARRQRCEEPGHPGRRECPARARVATRGRSSRRSCRRAPARTTARRTPRAATNKATVARATARSPAPSFARGTSATLRPVPGRCDVRSRRTPMALPSFERRRSWRVAATGRVAGRCRVASAARDRNV